MKRLFLTAALTAGLAGPALAFHCPKDMAQIDAALAQNPQISAGQMAETKELRAEGEAQHKAGKHQEAVDTLGKAKDILGIK